PFLKRCETNIAEPKRSLINSYEKSINKAKMNHRLWALYRSIQWYIWTAENHPGLGFSKEYARQLSGMTIPGNPKGEAVRMTDPGKGPLDRSLELPLIINALKEDDSNQFEHLQ